ncbi:beta-ketoacyl-ACP reductase [Deltaproteobacteria bacterium]|nr:beta-ketoacyl-ACP reductase [Deltaproteobacteria bacterium]
MLLKNKIALITGASRGIGQTIAQVFVSEGATVINGDISVNGTEPIQVSPGLYEVKLDVQDAGAIQSLVDNIVRTHGTIDILVNNAGICPPMGDFFEKVTQKEWDLVLSVNLGGMVRCTNAVLPHMRTAKFGRIISLASIAGETGGVASSVAYSASKAAIVCTTKVLAKKEGHNNITANCIAPGWIITEMTKDHKQNLSLCPLGKRGEPVDVANAALYLASEMGRYITGTLMDVNGGVHMH